MCTCFWQFQYWGQNIDSIVLQICERLKIYLQCIAVLCRQKIGGPFYIEFKVLFSVYPYSWNSQIDLMMQKLNILLENAYNGDTRLCIMRSYFHVSIRIIIEFCIVSACKWTSHVTRVIFVLAISVHFLPWPYTHCRLPL